MVCVLVVDDDAAMREMAARLLRLAGYSSIVAGSGTQALAFARTRSDIDVALIDITLPGMSGFDLARELRRLAPAVRVAFMSGFAIDDFKQPIAAPVVTKPFTLEELTRALQQALARSPSD
jgi:CheY-like chemotaxis protein